MATSASKPLPKTQRAAQYSPKTNSVTVNEITLPIPSAEQLLIKIAAASLCHTDLLLFEPNHGGFILEDGRSITIGHEATGTILSVPKSCTNPTLKVGARVGFLYTEEACFECAGCQIHNSWCENGRAILSGFGRDGFFQEYVVVNWRSAIVLPDALNICSATPLFCAGVTSWHAIVKAGIQPGEWMAIVGCGGLGNLGVQYATKLGYKVIAIDIEDMRLEDAKAFGALHTFNPTQDKEYLKKVTEITGGGCHVAINFTASKDAYDSTPALLRIGGIMMVVGVPVQLLGMDFIYLAIPASLPLTLLEITLNALEFVLGRYRVAGANSGIPQDMAPCIKFSAKHNIKSRVTFYELDQIQEMIDILNAGKARERLAVKFD